MNPQSESLDLSNFVCGIGASAGGLEAIEQLFENMPVNSGLAFVLVQHLSPDFKSFMPELLERRTSMPIFPVKNGMNVEPNSIYLIPARTEMKIADGRLWLKDRDPTEGLALPIDYFFRSLAKDCGPRGIAIVLSGTGSDGSRGIVDVSKAGGMVIVQDESTAQFDGMPRNARDSGIADIVASPFEIPNVLMRRVHDSAAEDLSEQDNLEIEVSLRQVLKLLREAHGIDFSQYKMNTIARRIDRRLTITKHAHIDEYAESLLENSVELDHLYHDLLIGVTSFYRDPTGFRVLTEDGITPIVENAKEGSEIRIWVAGCATGEEAYSLAIAFDEVIAGSQKRVDIKVFATDAHKESLEFASNGIYEKESLAELGEQRITKYFDEINGQFRVKRFLRQSIVFAGHNVIQDAPFTRMDLISCRNLLIYLLPEAQQKVLSYFHFSLKTGGFLFIGPSETTGNLSDEFESVDSRWRLFKKRRDVRLAPDARIPITVASHTRDGSPPILRSDATSSRSMLMSTYDALLDAVMPPSLLVSESGELIHAFGNAAKFLSIEVGRFSKNLYDRLPEDLKGPVLAAMRKALQDQKKLEYQGIQITTHSGDKVQCSVSVLPVFDAKQKSKTALIQIELGDQSDSELTSPQETARAAEEFTIDQVNSLEAELKYTRDHLQNTIEKYETGNEELQATNEELVASNEELQSTNEELHSVNEELYTVNAEHQKKIQELNDLSRDMEYLLESTEVHTLFLDDEMRIRQFTPQMTQFFRYQPQDVGRPITHFAHNLRFADLHQRISYVMSSGETYESRINDNDGNPLFIRILPFMSNETVESQQRSEGIVLTLVDIEKYRALTNAPAD